MAVEANNTTGLYDVDGVTPEPDGDVTVRGDLTVLGNTYLKELLECCGEATFEADVVMEKCLTVDSPTLYVDCVNHRIGVGTLSPIYKLDVAGGIHTSGVLVVDGNTTLNGNTTLGDADGDEVYVNAGDMLMQASEPWITFQPDPLVAVQPLSGIRGFTGLSDKWMIAAETPVDDKGRLIIGVGDNGNTIIPNIGEEVVVRAYGGSGTPHSEPWDPLTPVLYEVQLLNYDGNSSFPNNVGIQTTTPNWPLDVNGDASINGDLYVNGGDIITGNTTFNILNTNADTINFGGEATTIDIGKVNDGRTTVYHELTAKQIFRVGPGGGPQPVFEADPATNEITLNQGVEILWAEDNDRMNGPQFQSESGNSTRVWFAAPNTSTDAVARVSITATNDPENSYQLTQRVANDPAEATFLINTGERTGGTIGTTGKKLFFNDGSDTSHAAINPAGPTDAIDLTTKDYVDTGLATLSQLTNGSFNFTLNADGSVTSEGDYNLANATTFTWDENDLSGRAPEWQASSGNQTTVKFLAPNAGASAQTRINMYSSDDSDNAYILQFRNAVAGVGAETPYRILTGQYSSGVLAASGEKIYFVDGSTTHATIDPAGPTDPTDLVTKSYVDALSHLTYNIDATVAAGGANLNLNDSAAGVDSVKFNSGTGVTVDAVTANEIDISIGQPVGTTDDVAFNSVTIGGNAVYEEVELVTSTTTANQLVFGTTFTSAEIQVNAESGGDRQVIKGIMVQDGTTSYLTQYADILTNPGGGDLVTLSANQAGVAMQLLATPANAVTTIRVVIQRIA